MTEPSTSVRMPLQTKLYLYISLSLIAAIVLIPLLTTALGGFKTLGDLRVNPFGVPAEWQWANYGDILFGKRYWLQIFNSLVIALLTVFLTLTVSAMAAFTFAHVKFFGSSFLLNYFLLGLMFPAATAILPLFIRIRDLGLLDTYWGVVLPQVAFGLGMSILLFRNYFRNLPEELFQAAFVDGCGYLRFFWHISMPLSRPIVATVGIVSFVGRLEQLHPAADHAELGIEISLAARHHGLSRRIRHGMAARARLHHADDPADRHRLLPRTETHHRGPDGRCRQIVT